MSFYLRIGSNPPDIRFFNDTEFSTHPKRHLWELYTPPPPVVDPDPPILKEDLIRLAVSKNKLGDLRTALSALTTAETFYFTHVSTFQKNDPVYVKIKAELAKL